MEKFILNYIKFYYIKKCTISENETELDSATLLDILTKYSRNTSKQFLDNLFANPNIVLEKLSKLEKHSEILSAIFLDDLYLEKLDSAGYTLLLLGLLVPFNQDYVTRYVNVCSNLEANEEIIAINKILEVIICQDI